MLLNSILTLLGQVLPPVPMPNVRLDPRTNILLGSVIGILATSYFVGRALRRQPESTANPAVIRTLNLRIRAWWMMCVILIAGLWLGPIATTVLFGLISFWALREFITMTPTRRGDHRTLFWTFIVFTPLQYVLVGMKAYAIYTIMIPVYASLFVPALFTHTYDASVPIFRVAILLTPFAALPLDGVLRALGQTKYLFRIFFWRLVITVPAVLK